MPNPKKPKKYYAAAAAESDSHEEDSSEEETDADRGCSSDTSDSNISHESANEEKDYFEHSSDEDSEEEDGVVKDPKNDFRLDFTTDDCTGSAIEPSLVDLKKRVKKSDQKEESVTEFDDYKSNNDIYKFRVNPPRKQYDAPFEPNRPIGVQNIDPSEPVGQIWLRLVGDGVDLLLKETNRKGHERSEAARKRKLEKFEQEGKTDDRPWQWYGKFSDIDSKEMACFFAILIGMGLVEKPNYKDYWRKGNTECPITATPGFSQLLKQNRFETILRSIHLYNPADAKKNGWDDKEGPNWDPIHKCRQFIELVFARILEAYVPDRHVSIDEQMIPFQGRFAYKIRIENKPFPFGIKVFCISESITGFALAVLIYCKEKLPRDKDGPIYATVYALLENALVLDQGYECFTDNYYTSRKLFEDLLDRKTYCCGTVFRDAKLPARFLSKQMKDLRKMKRGQYIMLHTDIISFCNWKDRRRAFVKDSSMRIVKGGKVEKRGNKKGKKWVGRRIPQPSIYNYYNTYMGGVDHCNQMMQYSTRYFRNQRWYMAVACYVLNIAAVNAYVIKRESLTTYKQKRDYSMSVCRREIMEFLWKASMSFTVPNHRMRLPAIGRIPPKSDEPAHYPRQRKYKRGYCKLHYFFGIHRRTNVSCSVCKVPLCIDCFEKYHVVGTRKVTKK